MDDPKPTAFERLKTIVVGGQRDLHDKSMYHQITLAAFLAWVGLGSDGLSSACYGPPEAFIALGKYPFLGVFVALATAVTIIIISASYSQIIELFPSGGGGYLAASKLLSPRAGAVSGSALLVDYVLTIALSIASGADALFSFLPAHWQPYKLTFMMGIVLAMTVMNIRGVRESVGPLVPIFAVFVLAHLLVVVMALCTHATDFGALARSTASDVRGAQAQFGLWGMIVLIMHSYSMGAGTYTGIEAVSNGMAMLREPRVQTAKRTMTYMWVSLSVMAVGLMLTYLLYRVTPDPTGVKTLNAIMLDTAVGAWPAWMGQTFVIVTLFSEAAILCVAAQTGFLGGPRILANMALDRWLPARLSMLSDRLVTQNGVLIMSTAAIATLWFAGGSVSILIVLYSINVFITFALSQTGMVRHWWITREAPGRNRRLAINGVGLGLTLMILVWVTVAKFWEGGWVTLLVTGGLVTLVSLIQRHYANVAKSLSKFNALAEAALRASTARADRPAREVPCDPSARTAVVMVSGFNALGLHSVQNVVRYFGDSFRNFVFVGVGVVDAGNFKGAAEVSRLHEHVREQVQKYADLIRQEGYYAEAVTSVGTDIADQVGDLAPDILKRFPQSVFFAGQLIFTQETFITRWLHNNIAFAVQKRLYRQGVPFVIMPFRV